MQQFRSDLNIGWPRIVRTLEQQAAYEEQRRQQPRERARVHRADAAVRAQEQPRVAVRKQHLPTKDPAAYQAAV